VKQNKNPVSLDYFHSYFYFIIIVKRRKRIHNEATNGNVFVCASNITGNSNNESVVFVNNTGQTSGKIFFLSMY